MFLIGLIAFVTFFFALDDLVNRMNMNVVVILTSESSESSDLRLDLTSALLISPM